MGFASKHGFSFGASALTALTFLAIDHPEDTHNNNDATPRPPFPHDTNIPMADGTDIPMADFNVPLPVCEMGTNQMNLLSRPCSPFEGGAFDIDVDDNFNVLDDARRLMEDAPDEDKQGIDNMIDVPYDYLVNAFASPDQHDERFQNGFGIDMVRQGGYFRPVVHTRRRNDAFHASNMWKGPSPSFHGLPYSYAHRRRGRRHHFAEVFISTSIVARELRYNSPMQYVEARGWTFSKKRKLHYRQVQENIFRNSTGASAELHVGFKGMVNRLYDMIEKDGLKDPFTGMPAVNFLNKLSFIQKLGLHAQEFQMAVIIVKEFFIKHVEHHNGDVEYWMKEIFQSCLKHDDLVKFFNNIFSLFPEGDDPKLAKELLSNPDAMRDRASQLANAIEHKIRYSKLVEQSLQAIKQKTRADKKPSPTNHLLFARARARDWDKQAQPATQGYLIPSTTIQDQRKAKSGEKRNRPGKILCCL